MAKVNEKIGPYTLVSKLGRGAFGVVWLAEKRTAITTTKVALKLPNDEDIDLEAIKQEASLWVHASGHPNVLPIIDADIYDEQILIVSEYAPDGSLSDWLEAHGGKAPTIESAAEMTLGILAGLEHLHKRGIIHRDIKPHNILLQNETPRLADFGIARILKTTSKGTIAIGTPPYMPPEAFDGKRSEQTDVWSVGVIFYQLLTGRLPFPQTDISSLLMAIVNKEPEPLPDYIPESLQKVIERALQKNTAARFETATEMRKALRDAIQQQTSISAQEIKTEILPEHVIEPLPTTLDKLEIPQDKSRGKHELTEIQQLQLEYWTAFRDFLLQNNSSLKPQKPHPQHWFPLAIGRANFSLVATMHRKGRRLAVNIVLAGPDAKPHFHLFLRDKEVIEREIGEPLEWRERASGKESHILVSRPGTDPADRQDWESQFEWLQEKLELFHRVFAPKIKTLDASDYVPENDQVANSQSVSPVITAAPIGESTKSSSASPTAPIESDDSPPTSTLLAQPARKPNRLIWVLGIGILVIGLTVAFFTFNSSNSSDVEKLSPVEAEKRGIAATVNGKPIMLSEVDSLVSQQFKDQQTKLSSTQLATARLQVLDSLIQKEVLFQRADKEKLLPTEDEVTQFINNQKQQANITEEQYQKRLKEQNQTEQSLREEARKQIAVQKLQDKTNATISVSDKEVEEFYYANKKEFVKARGVQLSNIMVDPQDNNLNDDARGEAEAKQKIELIYQQLKSGSDFETVVRARSEDTNSSTRGGDLGFATEDDLKNNGFPKELIQDFFGLMQVGSITPPVRFSSARWYIFKLMSRQLQAETLTLDSPGVRSQITESLIKSRKELSNTALLTSAMNDAKIVNYLASKT